jgi:hypothetical protein
VAVLLNWNRGSGPRAVRRTVHAAKELPQLIVNNLLFVIIFLLYFQPPKRIQTKL